MTRWQVIVAVTDALERLYTPTECGREYDEAEDWDDITDTVEVVLSELVMRDAK